jgi:hypothetical protein
MPDLPHQLPQSTGSRVDLPHASVSAWAQAIAGRSASDRHPGQSDFRGMMSAVNAFKGSVYFAIVHSQPKA